MRLWSGNVDCQNQDEEPSVGNQLLTHPLYIGNIEGQHKFMNGNVQFRETYGSNQGPLDVRTEILQSNALPTELYSLVKACC